MEQRAEWGSSAIPGPGEAASLGSFATAAADLRSPERARQKVAIWSATDLLASLGSTLPLDTYRRVDDDTAVVVPNPPLIDDPAGDGNGTADWIYQYLMSKLLAGNAYGRESGFSTRLGAQQIVLYHPDDVSGYRDRQTGEARWRVEGREVPAKQVWHRRAYPMPGCLLGSSPISWHTTTIGQGVAAARFGMQFFTDGAHPTVVFRNTEADINDTQAKRIKSRYLATLWGSREPLVVGKGWEHSPIQVAPEESQFLETQKYTSAECARIYGPGVAEVLGYETGGSMTYANVESRSVHLLIFALDRWLSDVENMFTRQLRQGTAGSALFVRYNRAALLRTTTLDRYRAHALALANRWKVVNEVRDDEDMEPVEWGDKPNEPGVGQTPLGESGKQGGEP